MSRKIYISSDMSVDDRLIVVAEQSPMVALLWPWLLTAFDDWGRADANTKRLKARIFPANPLVTTEVLDEAIALFAGAGLVIEYEVDGRHYLAIDPAKWFQYQTHIRQSKRERDESRFPAPPREDERKSAQERAPARTAAQMRIARDLTPSPSPSPSPSTPFIPLPPSGVADEAGAPAPEKGSPEGVVEVSDGPNPAVNGSAHPPAKPRAAPKPDRVAEIIDLCRAEGIPIEVSRQDGGAVKGSRASPRLIFDAYRAAYRGDWDPGGNGWLQGNLSLTTVLKRIAGYQAWVDNGRTTTRPDTTDRRRSAGAGRGLPTEADRDRQDRELAAAFAGEPDDGG